MSTIEFTKMVAAGNDFVLVDNRNKKIEKKIGDLSKFAENICARKHSVGADGLLVLENSKRADITMRIFNPDASEVTMCGNGSRCAAYYAAKKGISTYKLSIETKAGILKAEVHNDAVKIEMMPPEDFKSRFSIDLYDETYEVDFINTGVPHVVYFVEDLDSFDVKRYGKEIRYHKEFSPKGTNANFVKLNDRHNISIRTYERGVEDETLACGTGAVAGAIVASELHSVESPVKVKTWGGDVLTIYFKKIDDEYRDIFLEGKVKLVYDGGLYHV
jgi:diaminopimelate epimerase